MQPIKHTYIHTFYTKTCTIHKTQMKPQIKPTQKWYNIISTHSQKNKKFLKKKKKKNTTTPDAQTQRTTYRNGEKRKRGYQKGVQWIGGNGFLLGSLAMANENEKLD
jgi:NAD kinase